MGHLLNDAFKAILTVSSSIRRFLTAVARSIWRRISLSKEHFIRSILVGIIVSIIVTVMSWLGNFRVYEYLLSDFFQNITHKRSKHVALLFITEREYREGFLSTSPLSRTRLAHIIDMLVKLKAKVIALDLDLSDPTNEDDRLLSAINRANVNGIPVVIVGSLRGIADGPASKEDPASIERPYVSETLHSSKEGFAAFQEMNPGSRWIDKVMHGGAAFRLDSDAIFRQAEAFYMVKGTESGSENTYHRVPSFPVAISGAYQGMSQKDLLRSLSDLPDHRIVLLSKRKENPQTIKIPFGEGGKVVANFIGDYRYFGYEPNLSRLLQEYGPVRPEGRTIFKDKVVIVGGSYDPKDFYMTPVGRISGMEILANVTQNILSGNLITHNSFLKAFTIEVILGIVVAFIFVMTSRLWAYTLSFAVFLPAIVAASFIAFANAYHWFDFVPTIAGVMLHETVHDLEKTLRSAKSRVQGRLAGRTKKLGKQEKR